MWLEKYQWYVKWQETTLDYNNDISFQDWRELMTKQFNTWKRAKPRQRKNIMVHDWMRDQNAVLKFSEWSERAWDTRKHSNLQDWLGKEKNDYLKW